MRIKFLGTGAADWPVQRPSDSIEYRRFSAAIINNEFLIDCGPQIMEALEEYDIDPKGIKYVINTHPHGDHFSEESLKQLTDFGAQYITMCPDETKEIEGYTIYAYAGNHGPCKEVLHYIIDDSQHKIFYGLDGCWLLQEEMQGIKVHQPDLAVFDATVGFIDGDYRIFEHNNLYMVLEMKKSLVQYIKQFCISHMARTLHTSHDILSSRMQEEDVITAYDGLEIDLTM